jgi:aminopeptidase N
MKKTIVWLSICWACLAGALSVEAVAAPLSVHHDLQVTLEPGRHRLTGVDRMRIETDGNGALNFFVSSAASDLEVTQDGRPARFTFDGSVLRVTPASSPSTGATLQVTIRYAAIFDDPVPAAPVNTDNPGYGVTATIGEQGTFLLAGAGWYPHLEAEKVTYRVQVEAPEGIIAVTAGRSLGTENRNGRSVSVWQVDHPVRGLALSAAPYQVEHRRLGKTTISTYFLADNQDLAQPYLEATRRYIQIYEDLFGPYPFAKFAVVENFFPTGYGFPSYTLLGGRVLRLPFIIDTSLGHEIAHCWWGNGVLVDYAEGNWSEALTTYVADYYYKEQTSPAQALERRRTMLRNYASLVAAKNDFPLRKFRSRTTPATRTVGYDKGAMVFHMLRIRLGEDAFWQGLRDVYDRYRFQAVSWRHFQQAFESRGNISLERFFDQWVGRDGAPQPMLRDITVRQENQKWLVEGRVVQSRPYYELTADLLLYGGGVAATRQVHLSGPQTRFRFRSDAPPEELVFDPQVNLFRRLAPSEIPPSVNSLKGAASVLMVLADDLEKGSREAASTLALSLGLKNMRVVDEGGVDPDDLDRHDLLLVGLPRDRRWLPAVNGHVTFQDDAFFLQNTSFDQPWDAFFGVGPHPTTKKRVAGIFLPLSPAFADRVASKVTHYGKYSYLAFSRGINRAKGTWPVQNSPVIYRWPQRP